MRGIVLRVGIVALIIVGGLVLRPFLSGSAGDLKVSDCFDPPAADTETVSDVQHQPCDQDHGAEVFFVGDYPGSGSDPYPTDDEMLTYLTSTCLPAYSTYTGTDFSAQDVFDVGWFQPTADGWKSGDQSVICYAYRLDEEKFKGSIKAG
jgi:hypothetical protein